PSTRDLSTVAGPRHTKNVDQIRRRSLRSAGRRGVSAPQFFLIWLRKYAIKIGHNNPLSLAVSIEDEVGAPAPLLDQKAREGQREGYSLRPCSRGRHRRVNVVSIFDVCVGQTHRNPRHIELHPPLVS